MLDPNTLCYSIVAGIYHQFLFPCTLSLLPYSKPRLMWFFPHFRDNMSQRSSVFYLRFPTSKRITKWGERWTLSGSYILLFYLCSLLACTSEKFYSLFTDEEPEVQSGWHVMKDFGSGNTSLSMWQGHNIKKTAIEWRGISLTERMLVRCKQDSAG